MATYDSWNAAIANFFTEGQSKGSCIFLSVDEEVLDLIVDSFLEGTISTDPKSDFVNSVTEQCVDYLNQRVYLENFEGYDNEQPKCIGFLGLLVLAAHNMQEEEDIDETNYFLRLREILSLDAIRGRPGGLPPGCTENFWNTWNNYLIQSGFLPTAYKGSGSYKYLNFPLSQAILRESDKDYLRTLFRTANLPLNFDTHQLGFWLSQQPINRKHLKAGLHHYDSARVWEFYQSAYRVYENDEWQTDTSTSGEIRTTRKKIDSGLYLYETLSGEASFRLFPKQPGRYRLNDLSIKNDRGSIVNLMALRPGFYCPLWEIQPFQEEKKEYEILGSEIVKQLVFPKRDYWILLKDPETEYGAYATWKPYFELGDILLVIIKNGPYLKEISKLKEAGLIQWRSTEVSNGYTIFRDVMVLSYEWGGYISSQECISLVETLTPRTVASISLSSGLRDPNQNAWLEGYPPVVKIFGFEKSFRMFLKNSMENTIIEEVRKQQEDISLPSDLTPDVYMIEAYWGERKVAEKLFRIEKWNNIKLHPEPQNLINNDPISTASLEMSGAIIVNKKLDNGAEYA